MARIGLDLRFWRKETAGLGRYSRNLLHELVKLDSNNQYTAVITPKDEPEFDVDIKTVVVDIPHYSPSEQTKLGKVLNEQNFDLVHFANFNHPVFYRRPFVVTIHDLILFRYPEAGGTQSPLKRLGFRKVMTDCRRAKRVLVPSKSTKNDLVSLLGFNPDLITVTPEGCEDTFRPATKAEVEDVIAKFQLPQNYFLYVSRWEEYKGLGDVVEAFRLVTMRYPQTALVVSGKPPEVGHPMRKAVEDAKADGLNVVTPGFVSDDDLRALYTGATAYVLPSWYEGFGLMMLEAFATGSPVIATDVSSLPEVGGNAALLFEPRNVEQLSGLMKGLIEQPEQGADLRMRGFDRLKAFSWKTMAEQTLQVYEEVLAGSR